MVKRIDTEAEINSIRLKEQASAPATPDSGYGQLYEKNDGILYFKNDAGSEKSLFGDLIDWSNSGTVVGFSSFTVKTILYERLGNKVSVYAYLVGTSNSTGTTFTLPYTNNMGQTLEIIGRGADNSGPWQAARMALSDTLNIVGCYSDVVGTGWTPSNAKGVTFQFWYYTTQAP